MNVCVCVVCCADPLTALHRSQELKALHKAGACNKFLEMWISSNSALGVGGDLSTPLLRWQTLVGKLLSAGRPRMFTAAVRV